MPSDTLRDGACPKLRLQLRLLVAWITALWVLHGPAPSVAETELSRPSTTQAAAKSEARSDLNAATPEALIAVKGIGQVIAKRIIERRARIGGRFRRWGQVRAVKGVGRKTLQRLRAAFYIR